MEALSIDVWGGEWNEERILTRRGIEGFTIELLNKNPVSKRDWIRFEQRPLSRKQEGKTYLKHGGGAKWGGTY